MSNPDLQDDNPLLALSDKIESSYMRVQALVVEAQRILDQMTLLLEQARLASIEHRVMVLRQSENGNGES